jgi:hypothetical protein
MKALKHTNSNDSYKLCCLLLLNEKRNTNTKIGERRQVNTEQFGRELAEEGIEKERIRYYGGQREYCYIGIKLRSDLRDQNKSMILN